ncbi:hypothetical protein [Sphingomonas bacterium]|uniref:hypothetical protein n=1 Tax=Sphingomonas bacterium TaxID=1895847 RepID=UPI00157517A8|nr:hypothetical protein [Sphingomonas bacterium]
MIRYPAALAIAACAAAPAAAQQSRQVTIAPYIEASQTLDADLNGGDVLTYTSVAAGIDAGIATQHTNGQASVRYERRIGEGKYHDDSDVVTGLVRASTRLTSGLGVDVGGLATRTREDIRGAAPGLLFGNDANTTQLYSVYGGPTLSTHAGDVAIAAAYRIGYTKVRAPGATGAEGLGRLDYFDHDLGQSAAASVGTTAGTVLPIGVTLSGGWNRDDASQLKQRFDDVYGQAGVLVPVLPTVALAGDVGYEKLTVSQKDAVLTAAGTPALDANGRYITDDASPRRVAYRTDGVYWDAGVVWHPNHRTALNAYVGHRYDSMRYTGSLTYQASKSTGLAVQVYDDVETFGHQLQDGLAALPTSFIAARDAFSQQHNGCVFTSSGSTPGGCLDSVFQSITTASYRARGVDGVVSVNRGLSTYGLGAGYENRELYAPNVPLGALVYGQHDQSAYGQFFYGRQLSRVSGIQANLFVNWYDSGTSDVDVWSYGATASYYHNFGRLGTTATLGIYDFKQADVRSQVSAQAQVAARYTF